MFQWLRVLFLQLLPTSLETCCQSNQVRFPKPQNLSHWVPSKPSSPEVSALYSLCSIFWSTPLTTIPEACSHQGPPREDHLKPLPLISCLLAPPGKPSSSQLCPGHSALHFPDHSSACIPGDLLRLEPTSSICNSIGLLPSGTTRHPNSRNNQWLKDSIRK